MDKTGIIDEVFEQGGQIVKKTAKQVTSAPSTGVKTAVSQVVPGLTPATDEENSPDKQKQQNQQKSQPKPTSNLSQQLKPDPAKVAEEQTQLAKVRQELHAKYYQDLVNRPKPKEERSAEKIEREEKEEEQTKFVKDQEKKKKELPINIRQGTGEKLTGIGG